MKEKSLLKIALICSLIGIFVLYLVSEKISIDEIKIEDLENRDIGDNVKIVGRVEQISNLDKVAFLKIGQMKTENIDVILFKDRDIELRKGDYVEIIGEIDDYEGKRQLIANIVKKI